MGTVIGVCPFCFNASSPEVEFEEVLLFRAHRDSTQVGVFDVELRYSCLSCMTAFSIFEAFDPLSVEAVKELQKRLRIENSKLLEAQNKLLPFGLIADFEQEEDDPALFDTLE